jgi:hypothetical protein
MHRLAIPIAALGAMLLMGCPDNAVRTNNPEDAGCSPNAAPARTYPIVRLGAIATVSQS